MKLLALLLVLVGCSTPSKEPFSHSPTRPFQSAGHEQFFLAELPHWANGSVSARCQRAFSVRYLDYAALERIHGLNYVQQVELQTQFNLKWRERFAGKTALVLTPQEEARLFTETLAQVKSGLRELRFPNEGKVNIVWWDSMIGKPKFKNWLMNLANQGNAMVLVSLCEGSDTLEKWLEDQDLDGMGAFVFGAESLGNTRPDGSIIAGLVSPWDAFFDQKRTTVWMGNFTYPAEFPAGHAVKKVED